MTQWRDLAEEDKIKVIGGTVMAVTISIACFVFAQFFLVEDRLHVSSLLASGVSPFSILRLILPIIYLVLVLPAAVAAGGTVAYLRKRSSDMINTLIILLGAGGYLLFVALLLTLFDVLLYGLPDEVNALLLILAFFGPAIIFSRILRPKKIFR